MICEVENPGKFQILYDLPKEVDLVICIGGRGGMKTYEVSKFAAFSATMKKKRIVVLRDEKAIIKESILNEIWARYDTANETGELDRRFDKNEYELKDKATGKVLIYTKGFRASTKTKKTNLKGSSDIDIAIIEEGEDVRDKDKFYTFIDSLRKEGAVVIVILNTPDVNHFIIKNYFNTTEVTKEDVPELGDIDDKELDGYYKITPRVIRGFKAIQSNYTDNLHLQQNTIVRYQTYGDPKSPLYDLHYYLTAIKGYASTGMKGQILKKVKPISLADYMNLPLREFFGQDFGTAKPAALVGVKFDKNNCYCRQLNYLPMDIKSIGKLYCQLNFGPGDKVIADSAEPESWGKLKAGWPVKELSNDERMQYPQLVKGFFVVPANKGPGSIKYRITLMKSLNLFAVEESKDLWDEIRKWRYATDKNGNYLDDPVDEDDHLIDGWCYVVIDQRGKNQLYGI